MQGDTFETKIVVRKWADIDPELEFRTFVSKVSCCTSSVIQQGNVTGITQYHMKCFIPDFLKNKEKIGETIVEQVKRLNHLVGAPDDTYTIDFVFSVRTFCKPTKPSATRDVLTRYQRDFETCTLIEINDPPPTAGTSLFIWDNPDDQKIIFEVCSF